MTTDILMTPDTNGDYDISLDESGDIANGDFFDTSLLYSIFGERRALSSEVPTSSRRGGWIGNEFEDYENGSKIWLYYQESLTRTIINKIESEAINSLQWLLDDDFAVGTINATGTMTNESSISLLIDIKRTNSEVEQRYFELWNNTGINDNAS
jgi:phage gp46-like protein